MKKLYLLLLIFSLAYLGCKKEKEDGPGEVYGTWKLTETMNDPGDGSGKYMKVKGDSKYVTLERSGDITGDALTDFHRFNVLDSARIEFLTKASQEKIIYYYKVSAGSLTLNPPCIEGCGLRFVRK
jgi:hypothetical protein